MTSDASESQNLLPQQQNSRQFAAGNSQTVPHSSHGNQDLTAEPTERNSQKAHTTIEVQEQIQQSSARQSEQQPQQEQAIEVNNNKTHTTFTPRTIPKWTIPPTTFNSSFVMQQGALANHRLDSKTERFKRQKFGAEHAETYYKPSSFNKTDFHQPVVKSPSEIPNGRPLWLDQIKKHVPAAAQYDIEQGIGSKAVLLKTRTTSFRNHAEGKNQPMIGEAELLAYHNHPKKIPKEGIASYDVKVEKTKRTNPSYSVTKDKKSKLWDEEVKLAQVMPAPDNYTPKYHLVQPSRSENRSMGRDIKVTSKEIKKTPGPGEYNNHFDNRGSSKNHMLKHGWDTSKETKLRPEDLSMLNTTAQYLHHKNSGFNRSKQGSESQRVGATVTPTPVGHNTNSLLGHSQFTMMVRNQQPPMCTGKVLKIQSEVPVLKAKQSQARSVYAQDVYKIPKNGCTGLEIESNNDVTAYEGPRTVKASDNHTENTFFNEYPSPKRSYDPVSGIQPIANALMRQQNQRTMFGRANSHQGRPSEVINPSQDIIANTYNFNGRQGTNPMPRKNSTNQFQVSLTNGNTPIRGQSPAAEFQNIKRQTYKRHSNQYQYSHTNFI